MVRKPATSKAGGAGAKAGAPASGPAPGADSPKDRIIEALLALAAEEPWEAITIPKIAARADVSLADFRDAFPSKGAILAGFAKKIDRQVLAADTSDLADEPPHERVFDVLMRRIDALAPYKVALQRIARAVRREPLTLAALHQVALNSQRFMLIAAGIDVEGPLGLVKIEGAVGVFARTLETWFEDDDPGLARTMARLNRELRQGERLLTYADDVYRLTAPFRAFARAVCEGPSRVRRRYREDERSSERRRDDEGRRDGERDNGDDYTPAATI